MTADGAYDGEAVYDVVAERHPDTAVIIPPRVTAVPSKASATPRDKNLATIVEHGRISWQRSSGYNRRSLVETTMFRYKTVIGRRLRARILPNQRTEAKIGCNVLNRMTGLGAEPPLGSADTQAASGEGAARGLFTHQRVEPPVNMWPKRFRHPRRDGGVHRRAENSSSILRNICGEDDCRMRRLYATISAKGAANDDLHPHSGRLAQIPLES
jgi:transposase